MRIGGQPPLELDPSRAVLLFKTPASRPRNLTLQLLGLDVVQESWGWRRSALPVGRPEPTLINDTPRATWIRQLDDAAISSDTRAELGRRLGSDLRAIAPVYRVPGSRGAGGLVCLLPDVLIVQPAPGATPQDLAKLDRHLRPLGLTYDDARGDYVIGFRLYRVRTSGRTAVDLAPSVQRRGGALVRGVKFERLPMVKPLAFAPNDEHYDKQWSLERIEAPAAWDTGLGEPSIVVAVLDSGCDRGHPDLRFAPGGRRVDTLEGDGSPPNAISHGTNCAGIIAARTDNEDGVAGIAGRCPVLPLALVELTEVEVATGLRYAADQGARVVNMSFGQYGPDEELEPTGWDFDLIDPSIEYAFERGVLLCASTGNDDNGDFNSYPARHPLVMACGASSFDDDRKTPDSPDDECWGSNYAPGMSVVAPGVNIPTTDIRGHEGRNDNGAGVKAGCVSYGSAGDEDGDYYFYFNGTSSAVPHLSGVAALVLSANVFLDHQGARRVIEMTADKVGSRAYADTTGRHPSGSWNRHMGYGRINARRAVELSAALHVQHANQMFE